MLYKSKRGNPLPFKRYPALLILEIKKLAVSYAGHAAMIVNLAVVDGQHRFKENPSPGHFLDNSRKISRSSFMIFSER